MRSASWANPVAEFDLARFVDAQAPVIAQVGQELTEGRRRSHWMWFVFPQLRGLGVSAMSQRYAIASLDEARAYLAHPTLGPTLLDCTLRVLGHPDRAIHDIFGSPDDMKFQSCMTLFAEAGEAAEFRRALDVFFGGRADGRTLGLLEA